MSDMRNGDVLAKDGKYFLVTEIPSDAFPIPDFEVGQEVWSSGGREGRVVHSPIMARGAWVVPIHNPFDGYYCVYANCLTTAPSTATKTIRVTGDERDDEKIQTWLDCAPKGVTVEVEDE